MATVHIESKKEDIAKIVLMPGDPKRCEFIAMNYLKDVKQVNSVRGMNAYTGYYQDKMITVFPSGMGIPSMGIYSYELFKEYDVDYIIRLGTCGGYDESLKLKDLILVENSYSESNYAKSLNGTQDKIVKGSQQLNELIYTTSKANNKKIIRGNIYCSDAFYEKEYDFRERSKELDVLGIEMETFALFNNARYLKKEAAAILTVSDVFFDSEKLTSSEREKEIRGMIELALDSCLKL